MAFLSVLNQSAEGRELQALFKVSAWELIPSMFKGVRIQVHLLRLTTEMMMLLEAPGIAFGLMFMAGLHHMYRLGLANGGSRSFNDSLVRCIQHHGGVVKTGTEVNKIETDGVWAIAVQTANGQRFVAKQAIIAGLLPWKLDDFVGGTEAQWQCG